MAATGAPSPPSPHAIRASAWIERFAPLVAPGATCSISRADTAVMRASSPPAATASSPSIATRRRSRHWPGRRASSPRQLDLESGAWPLAGEAFDAIVVTNYLHRPLFPLLLDALADDGVLLYETFARGNEAYGRPTNPDFLLRTGRALAAGGAPPDGDRLRAGRRRGAAARRRRAATGGGRPRPPVAAGAPRRDLDRRTEQSRATRVRMR